jgi:hypothetical protein
MLPGQTTQAMSNPDEFTPKELFLISLYKEPATLFKKVLVRRLPILVASVGLIIYACIAKDISFGILGYGLLLVQALVSMFQMKRGLQTMKSIITKYEARLKNKT